MMDQSSSSVDDYITALSAYVESTCQSDLKDEEILALRDRVVETHTALSKEDQLAASRRAHAEVWTNTKANETEICRHLRQAMRGSELARSKATTGEVDPHWNCP